MVSYKEKLGAHLTWGLVTGILLLYVFSELAEGILYNELGTFDQLIGNSVRSLANADLTTLALFFTTLGSGAAESVIMLLLGVYLLLRRHRQETIMLAVSLAGGALLNITLKLLFHRARPEITHLITVGGYSFPSGHAMVAASFYGMLGYLAWKGLRKKSKSRLAWLIAGLTVVLVIAIGLSRIYLGVHYPSDVLAGFAAGGTWLTACVMGYHQVAQRQQSKTVSKKNTNTVA